MSKRVAKQLNSFKYKGEPVRITLGTFLLTILCVLLIIIATFTQITIIHPIIPIDTFSYFAQDSFTWTHFIKKYEYIPQIPMIFFIVSLMGRRFGMLAVILYIALGLFFPIFALGGGISYLFEYGFGYILAFLPAIFLAGTLLKGNYGLGRVILISIAGVLTIHILGVLYMLFIATLRQATADLIISWIFSQSGIQILYDIFFTIIGIWLGKQARKLLWIVMC